MSGIRIKSTGIFIIKIGHARIEDSFNNNSLLDRIFFERLLVLG